ncbi:hypothetical protein, partial [Pseudomonas sp. TWR1-1-4]
RAFYSSLICCQVIIFRSFRRFLQQLQPLALPISRQREANNTALKFVVNPCMEILFYLPKSSGCHSENVRGLYNISGQHGKKVSLKRVMKFRGAP